MNDLKVRVRCHRLSNNEIDELSTLLKQRSDKSVSDFCATLQFTPTTMAELTLLNTRDCRDNNKMDVFASVYPRSDL